MGSLKLQSVRKSFGDFEALKGVDLDISDGEFVVFVGPSGCGKSTLLRVIAGLEEHTSGHVLIDDRVVDVVPPAKRGIAMVFQTYALYPHLSARGNMELGLKQEGTPRAEIDKRYAVKDEDIGARMLRYRFHVNAIRWPREDEPITTFAQIQGVVVAEPIFQRHAMLVGTEIARTIVQVSYLQPSSYPGSRAVIPTTMEIAVSVPLAHPDAAKLLAQAHLERAHIYARLAEQELAVTKKIPLDGEMTQQVARAERALAQLQPSARRNANAIGRTVEIHHAATEATPVVTSSESEIPVIRGNTAHVSPGSGEHP